MLKEGIQLFDLKNIYLNIYKMKKKRQIQLIATDYSPKILKNKNLFYLGSWCSSKKMKEKNFKNLFGQKKQFWKKIIFIWKSC